ncbi:hypothetical protein L1987_02368 [Smallanthus sonchifolius]|uniref:Uncharacterized protein n=1 Tax=Smallanthus sonchifolius TaxID=185202 RepID=A0ACB9K7K3_9ASTR|nr:hypothetical protein L1987_02368 [Smallanthus sonchifolius]
MGIISRGPTQATPENTLVPAQQGPIPTRPQLPMSQLLAAQNIPYLPYTPYYPWQNMGMGATPLYQAGPSIFSNPASHSARRGAPQPGNDRVILQAESTRPYGAHKKANPMKEHRKRTEYFFQEAKAPQQLQAIKAQGKWAVSGKKMPQGKALRKKETRYKKHSTKMGPEWENPCAIKNKDVNKPRMSEVINRKIAPINRRSGYPLNMMEHEE